MLDSFWRNYVNSYIAQLRSRSKWKVPQSNLEVGLLVIMRKEDTPPLQWPLARIIDVFPGKGGLVRTAKLQTSIGQFDRAVTELVKLPVEAGDCQ